MTSYKLTPAVAAQLLRAAALRNFYAEGVYKSTFTSNVKAVYFEFVYVVLQAPYFATIKEITFFTDLPRARVYELILLVKTTIQQEHERSMKWQFKSCRNSVPMEPTTPLKLSYTPE